MLQQTRVAAVLDYYRRFLKRFPDVAALARAKEAEVLSAWSGLGYYRRARSMHAAAQKIVSEYDSKVPANAEELEQLPGIGRYTAAAIASIAFDEPVAVVDGNVERVLGRLRGRDLQDRQETWHYAEALLDPSRAGDWNQAMMELGATVCLPVEPKCLVCPLQEWCKEPGRRPKKVLGQRHKKELVFGLAHRRGNIYLVQRSSADKLMAGMWELPIGAKENGAAVVHRTRHSITNTDYSVLVKELAAEEVRGGKWIARRLLPELPVTGLTRKILRLAKLWPEE